MRSSWLTMETNSSLRSSSIFCSVTSRSTTHTPRTVPRASFTGVTVHWMWRSKSSTSSSSTCEPLYSQPRMSSEGSKPRRSSSMRPVSVVHVLAQVQQRAARPG